MKNKFRVLCLAFCGTVFCGAFAADLAELVRRDVAEPVRPPAENGGAFWNKNAIQFMYPPSFDFTALPKSSSYCYQVVDAKGVNHSFVETTPTASLARVWADLPTGLVTVWCFPRAPRYQYATRSFWKSAPYRPGAFPQPKTGFREAAVKGLLHIRHLPAMETFVRTGRPDPAYSLNCYPAKIHSATVLAMALLADLSPAHREEALALARPVADYLLSIELPASSPLAHFTPTYEGTANAAGQNVGKHMVCYSATVGLAYLDLYRLTKEEKYLAAADRIAATYVRLQGADGSWPLKVREADGVPVSANRVQMTDVVRFLDAATAATGKDAYRVAADRMMGYYENGPLKDWNWDGQFEDVKLLPKYENLAVNNACEVAVVLLTRGPTDARKVALARALCRFAEDQFLSWEQPFKNEKFPAFMGVYVPWAVEPNVVEQYGFRLPVSAHVARVAGAFRACAEATGDPLMRAKARDVAGAIVRLQEPSGRIPTMMQDDEAGHDLQSDWVNCTYEAIRILAQFDGKM